MVITGVDHFASVCETKLVEWYHKHKPSINIARHNVVIVWSSKVLQNYKCLVATTVLEDEWYSNEAMKERGVVQIPLCFLAKSLENMSLCHAAYFCKGWENARGCRIEHDAAVAYGLDVIYEE